AGGSPTSYSVRCSAYRSFVNVDAGGTPVARWGTCRSDPASSQEIRRCFCVDGLRCDPFCGVCVNSNARSRLPPAPLLAPPPRHRPPGRRGPGLPPLLRRAARLPPR
ncbi:unnamed protein product, partial [Musa acuminata var. zebrina]